MASVRKIVHSSGDISWQARIKTLDGKDKAKNHPTKKAADAWIKQHDGAGATGSASMTVQDLAQNHNRWFHGIVRAGERDQRTLDGYESHLAVHVQRDQVDSNSPFPAFPKTLLSELDTPRCQAFLDRVIARTGSVETARRVRRSLSAWCAHGARNGWLKGNPVAETKIVQKRKRRADARVTLPSKDDLDVLLKAAAEGPFALRDTAIVHLLMFGGLRISELLGAADEAVELRRSGSNVANAGGTFHVQETLCSRWTVLGDVKSDDGLRDVPLGATTSASVREWRAARGPAEPMVVDGQRRPGRLFPAPPGLRFGQLWSYQDFRRLCWNPLMARAGLVEDAPGKPAKDRKRRTLKVVAFGPHTLRHVYASLQIESGVTPKKMQQLMGHATLAMTMDLYGHLWSDPVGDQALADASERLMTSRS